VFSGVELRFCSDDPGDASVSTLSLFGKEQPMRTTFPA